MGNDVAQVVERDPLGREELQTGRESQAAPNGWNIARESTLSPRSTGNRRELLTSAINFPGNLKKQPPFRMLRHPPYDFPSQMSSGSLAFDGYSA